MVLPADTQFMYLDPHVAAIREALEQGFSIAININSIGAKPKAVYEVSRSRGSIEELIAGCGIVLGAEYEKAERHEIEQFGVDGELRKKIIDSLDNGFPIFLIPEKGLEGGTHYAFWCAVYNNS